MTGLLGAAKGRCPEIQACCQCSRYASMIERLKLGAQRVRTIG